MKLYNLGFGCVGCIFMSMEFSARKRLKRLV